MPAPSAGRVPAQLVNSQPVFGLNVYGTRKRSEGEKIVKVPGIGEPI